MFSALVVILLLAGPSLQQWCPPSECPDISSLEESAVGQVQASADLPAHNTQTGDETKCRCRCKDDGICQCQVCAVDDIDLSDCKIHDGPNLNCSSLFKLESADGQASLPDSRSHLERWAGPWGMWCQAPCADLSVRADLLAPETQTRRQTKCRCRCKGDGICQCEVCPVKSVDDLTEPGRPCKIHEGPNLSCSSLQKSADLEAHKTQTRQQIQCSCTDYFNGSWRCQVCVNNDCKSKLGRGPKPAACSHSWGPWRSNINYHGDDDLRAHKSQYQCNCQCDDDGCQGQCCDGNGCTSNPGCSRSSLELWSDNNYHGDDDIRAHKSLQCQCQCQNGVCQGNGCNNPACWF